MKNVQQPAERVVASVERVIVGKHAEVRIALVALLCEGHILIEDVPGVGKTMLAKALSQTIGCVVPSHPVHARPAAVRRHRRLDLQPEDAGVRVPARADHGPGRPGRRDQPRHAEDAERPARVHGGAAGDDRRRHVPDAVAVPRHRHPEPDRVRGHLRAARGAARPVHAAPAARLSEADGGARHPRRAEAAPPDRGGRRRSLGLEELRADAGRDQGGLRRPGRGRVHRAPGARHARAPRRLPGRLAARIAEPVPRRRRPTPRSRGATT